MCVCCFNFLNNSYYNLFINNKTKRYFASWKVYVQIMPISDANNLRFKPFNVINVWSLKNYPKLEIGLMILNQNPDNYSAEVKQGGDLYRNMGEAEKASLVDKFTGGLSRVIKTEIILKSIVYFSNADSDLGNRLKKSTLI